MWKKTLGFVSLVALLLLLASADEVQGQKKKGDDDKAERATPQDYAALLQSKQVNGTVFYVDPGGKSMVLRMEYAQYAPNPNYKPLNLNANKGKNNNAYRNNNRNNKGGGGNYMQQYNKLMQQYNQAVSGKGNKNGQQQMNQIAQQMQRLEMQMRMQAGQQMQRNQMQMMQQMMRGNAGGGNGPFKVTTVKKEFELELKDSVTVRKMFLPSDFDDMGNQKVYSKEEIARLRGKDASKPGYEAKFDDLLPGQEVTVYLAKGDDRPVVSMVVMTREMAVAGLGAFEAKKKKK